MEPLKVEPLEEYQTEDGFKMVYVHSDTAFDLDGVHIKAKGAIEVGLRAIVIPKRIESSAFNPQDRYVLHLYRAEKQETKK